jgi:two-component system, LytTR family, response regulator
MTLTCVILEDEPLARSLVENYVSKVPHLQLLQSFSDSMKALDYLRENKVDILFSDIQMPDITGIALLKILQKKPLVILTTAYSEYAIEGYELDVFDYLLKPISFERFLKSVEKATLRLTANDAERSNEKGSQPIAFQPVAANFIFIKDGTKLIKVKFEDILYIEGLKDYVSIITKEKKIVSLQAMKSLEAQLPENQFIRVHNSYIVYCPAIEVVEKDRILIAKNYIPISDTYKKAFKDYLDRNQLGA